MIDLLNKIQVKYQLSYIFISHDMKVIRLIADYIVVLKNGKIIEEGETEKVFAQPKNIYTKNLLSSIL